MATTTKERGIIFAGSSVRAILAGRKTQTRRVVKPQAIWPLGYQIQDDPSFAVRIGPDFPDIPSDGVRCPYPVGSRPWVRETHYKWTGCQKPPADFVRDRCYADHPELASMWSGAALRKIPSIHMPRCASRLTLEITEVRVERAQEISHENALAEGCTGYDWVSSSPYIAAPHTDAGELPVEEFERLWDSLNAKRGYGWDKNPWVWAYTFKVDDLGATAGA